MSIQDESFPYDDMELSYNSGKQIAFPNHRAKSNKVKEQLENGETKVDENNMAINEEELISDRDNSTESSNSCPPESETSGKTNASEPTENEPKKPEFSRNAHPNKSISYQDIHSEYTKRRYKHVESKVGQYIANMKALDKKKRTLVKFHYSLPETMSVQSGGVSVPELSRQPSKHGIFRRSADDLSRMLEQDSHSDHEAENYDNLTATTSSSSRDGGILLDKQIYDQLLSAKERYEYVQTKLDEKNADYWRVKNNLETMRVEYTLCKDKLKQLSQTHRLSGSIGASSFNLLRRTSLNSLLYTQETIEKATQTEVILTPSPVALLENGNEMFATPLTPESNNNSTDFAAVGILAPAPLKIHKTVATIQPLSLNFSNLKEQDRSRESCMNTTMGFFRHRSNPISASKKSTPIPAAVANTSNASTSSSSVPSGDSAIDIEVLESPQNKGQKLREELALMEQHTQCNAGRSYTETDINFSAGTSLNAVTEDYCSNKRRKNLRNRIKRLFGACTKCDDANISRDSLDQSQQQQSYSQIPLLEKSQLNPSQKK